ncbi:hypothetical protein [Streptomyces sp. JHA26]|uniref:SCO2400 family protein n=1 Tax=Streptomyces sp. JHA26 TaxID=1917143 RepID=UPI0015C55F7B|nr:hypothetical protein [Streptomyces sp. JHA26]
MDYCHPCRRHLNGALACPGCGTPAEQLPASQGHSEDDETRPPRDADEPGVASDAARPAGGGRTSRRDRKAAAHRRRRRRTLLVAAGFVLAAGGLSLAELGMDAGGSPARPAAAGGETADGASTREVGETERAGDVSAVPVDDTSVTAPTSATPSPSASTSASPSTSASVSASPGADESQPPAGPDSPSTPPLPDATPPAESPAVPSDAPPTTTPPTPTASPDPTPTETCDRFLWWCT